MCKYCNGKDDRTNLLDSKDSSIELEVWVYQNHLAMEQQILGFDSVEINYCPMCGRKLGVSK